MSRCSLLSKDYPVVLLIGSPVPRRRRGPAAYAIAHSSSGRKQLAEAAARNDPKQPESLYRPRGPLSPPRRLFGPWLLAPALLPAVSCELRLVFVRSEAELR